MKSNSYSKFALMLAVSFVVMYSVMFLNVDSVDHIYLSLNRLYMTLLMVAPMAVFMLLFMGGMYKDKKINTAIYVVSISVFVGVFAMLRNQTLVGDVQYMKAMIPHHSSAILTSQNALIEDPEVRKLADDIIKAQEKEIAQMKAMLDRLEK
ncbi:DUF305 domain-containing protein [Rhabdobacter roseus]|jgi:hypothetical protein|uniref:DUF305 domain-containing protein n=1 Tax=Rhabdobacter roseus TaxID=1655419 RepID=A0A840TVS5_9BACT|nr:DUF305 domain-containing protein [Rhabdobacter roseus]MBB5287015.1 hypothetical protein [Rhabdobacter roseus]